MYVATYAYLFEISLVQEYVYGVLCNKSVK